MNIRQTKFCNEYLISGNATQAYKKAGFKRTKNARISASVLLTNPNIKAYIEQKQAEMTEKSGITAQAVVEEIAKTGFAKPEKKRASHGDKVRALDLLGKHLGIYERDNQQKAEVLAAFLKVLD